MAAPLTPLRLDGPVLLFGGPTSNLQALIAVLGEARARGVPRGNVISTGDLVAYGADPKPCVDLVRAEGVRVVQGNCEVALAAGAGDCGCGFAPGSACDLASAVWFAHAGAALDAEDRAWMRALPPRLDVEVNGVTLAVIHGALRDVNRFVFPSAPARVKALDLATAGTDGIVAGHSGLPFSQVIGGRLWHNPGNAGLPANDGTPRAWVSLLTPGDRPRELRIEHLALTYNHAGASAAMRAAGLPEGYAAALRTGLWPSCDVLPAAEAKATGRPLTPGTLTFAPDEPYEAPAWPAPALPAPLDPAKFRDPDRTAKGEPRARVGLEALRTLWVNTGTLCNLACANCYIESSPRNDRLAYITAAEVGAYLDEIARDALPTELIGFTGGEPFMNPDMIPMLSDALGRGHRALVLTNAMRPMQRHRAALKALNEAHSGRLAVRVSIDHYTPALHELERGPRSWAPTVEGMGWLAREGFDLALAGRLYSGEAEGTVRAGYARLLAALDIPIDALDPARLVLFPEMDAAEDVSEISHACWGILGRSPGEVMCASSRMVVKRRGAAAPAVLACTLLAYDEAFELGASLREASRPVALNHPHCARFCVLGGAACSAG